MEGTEVRLLDTKLGRSVVRDGAGEGAVEGREVDEYKPERVDEKGVPIVAVVVVV